MPWTCAAILLLTAATNRWSNHIIYHPRMVEGIGVGGAHVLVPGAKGQILTIVRNPVTRCAGLEVMLDKNISLSPLQRTGLLLLFYPCCKSTMHQQADDLTTLSHRFLSAYYKGNRVARHGMSLPQWIHRGAGGSTQNRVGGNPRRNKPVHPGRGGRRSPPRRLGEFDHDIIPNNTSTDGASNDSRRRRLQMHSLNSMCIHLLREDRKSTR